MKEAEVSFPIAVIDFRFSDDIFLHFCFSDHFSRDFRLPKYPASPLKLKQRHEPVCPVNHIKWFMIIAHGNNFVIKLVPPTKKVYMRQ